jgi:hypothetical protein
MFEEIAREISSATANRKKAVTVHFLVLVNAELLQNVSASEFCEKVGLEPSWEVEYKKMLNLARELKLQGIQLVKDK